MPDPEIEWSEAVRSAKQRINISVGDIYEDSAYHPCLCVGVNYEDDEIWGISLIDGSYPRSCSLMHSGVKKMSMQEALQAKEEWPETGG